MLARFGLMLLEMALIRAHLVRGRHTVRDTFASIGMRAGNYATNVALAGATIVVFTWIYQFRVYDISMSSPWAWAAIVVLDDLAYYWFHRISHERTLFWASHVAHHQSEEYNLTTALRQTSTGFLVGWVFYIPCFVAGVPAAV